MTVTRRLHWWTLACLLGWGPLSGVGTSQCAWAQSATSPPAGDVSSLVTVTKSAPVYNSATKTFDSVVTVANTSTETLYGPMFLVVSNISPGTVTLVNSLGATPAGGAFVDIPTPQGSLAPGQSISNVLLQFGDPKQVEFKFTTSVISTPTIISPYAADPTLAISTMFDGSRATLFGTKDAQGLPTGITGMVVAPHPTDPTKNVTIKFDGQGRLQSAQFANGDTVQFQYVSATKIDISFSLADGSVSATFAYDPVNHSVTPGTSGGVRSGARGAAVSLPPEAGTVQVECGSTPLTGATLAGEISGNFFVTGPLQIAPIPPPPGLFEYFVPRNPLPPFNGAFVQFIQSASTWLDGKTGAFCTFLKDNYPPGQIPLITEAILPFCEPCAAALASTYAAAEVVCEWNDILSYADVAIDILDMLRHLTTPEGTLQFTASFRGQVVKKADIPVVAGRSPPNVQLNFPTALCASGHGPTLTVVVNGPGTVTGPGINCGLGGNACSYTPPNGTLGGAYNLSASSAQNVFFDTWAEGQVVSSGGLSCATSSGPEGIYTPECLLYGPLPANGLQIQANFIPYKTTLAAVCRSLGENQPDLLTATVTGNTPAVGQVAGTSVEEPSFLIEAGFPPNPLLYYFQLSPVDCGGWTQFTNQCARTAGVNGKLIVGPASTTMTFTAYGTLGVTYTVFATRTSVPGDPNGASVQVSCPNEAARVATPESRAPGNLPSRR
jgi:hypothetical protein